MMGKKTSTGWKKIEDDTPTQGNYLVEVATDSLA